MRSPVAIDPMLQSFRQALAELYGPALDRVVLFGSRARGDAREDSDYDVAVFLKETGDQGTGKLWAEWDRLADLRVRFLDAGGPFIEAIPFRVSDYHRRAPLMHEIRQDGLTP
jgi:predicted nucleotidyltransferase